MLVDTGSQTLAIFCDICVSGCVVDQEFITAKSTSFENVNCGDAIRLWHDSPYPSIQECLDKCRYNTQVFQCSG